MARITIDDCIDKVENQFDLALLASKRAMQITNGSAIKVSERDDKAPVLALREIAEGHTNNNTVLEEEIAVLEAKRKLSDNDF